MSLLHRKLSSLWLRLRPTSVAPQPMTRIGTGYLTPDGGGWWPEVWRRGRGRRRRSGARRWRRRGAGPPRGPPPGGAAAGARRRPRAPRAGAADAVDHEVDARRAGAGTDGNQPPAVDALADQEVAHDLGALLCLGLREALGVHLDADFRDFRMPLHDQGDQVDELGRAVLDLQLAAAADEADALVELDALLGQARDLGARIRAAVVVLVAVQRLGLRRALVDRVGDAVLVVVRIGAAVLVLEAVRVLGVVRAIVEVVGDAVGVVVRIRAAVVVLEAVAVLGLVGALVDGVGHAVAVGVLGRRRAAVVRLLALAVLGRVRAGVVDVGDAVLVVVGLGAAVLVLELIDVLGLVRALVLARRGCVSKSLSGSGQPSWSWKPSRSSGSSGHLSLTSKTPSLSRSRKSGAKAAIANRRRSGAPMPLPKPRPPPAVTDHMPLIGVTAGDVRLERVDVRVEVGELGQAAAPEHLQHQVDAALDRVGGRGAVEQLVTRSRSLKLSEVSRSRMPRLARGAHLAEVGGADRLDAAGDGLVAQVGAAVVLARRQRQPGRTRRPCTPRPRPASRSAPCPRCAGRRCRSRSGGSWSAAPISSTSSPAR